MQSNHLIVCHFLLLLSSIFPTFRVFSNPVGSLYQVSKILELQLQHQSFQWIFSEYWFQWIFNEYWFPLGLTGLISLRFKGLSRVSSNSTNQKHLIHKEKKRKKKASNPWHSASFMVELSHLYMTTWKTIALTIWTSVSQVMSLLFNMLSKFVIAFLPRSKCLLIAWLQ